MFAACGSLRISCIQTLRSRSLIIDATLQPPLSLSLQVAPEQGFSSAERAPGTARESAAGDAEGVAMSDSIVAASRRLSLALDGLEAAVDRRREADLGEEALASQIQALGTDRSRLAAELDLAAAHSKRLETANREIARRLDLAIKSIRSVINLHDR